MTKPTGAAFVRRPSPCAGCSYQGVCRLRELACQRFERWVSGFEPIGPRIPTRAIYAHIYNDEEEAA